MCDHTVVGFESGIRQSRDVIAKARERISELTPGQQPPPPARPTRDRRPNRSSTAAAQQQHNSSIAVAQQQPGSHYQHQHQEVNCRRSFAVCSSSVPCSGRQCVALQFCNGEQNRHTSPRELALTRDHPRGEREKTLRPAAKLNRPSKIPGVATEAKLLFIESSKTKKSIK
ncbi:unnamed protein product [Trichogramma brassicae]|uniref:Uncharacterized protein n=1 Tax=Trichogramma brassicae TaxID=86971 RepID=A0A6H5IP69_9HYME|nr:unnamed protein product [Trichogramma brassicae]